MAFIPLKDFFRNPQKSNFQISPDGKHIAFLAPFETRKNIFIQRRGENSTTRATSVIDRDLSSFFWKGNECLIYARDFNGDENHHLFLATIDGSTEKDLTPFPESKCNVIDPLEEDHDHILISTNQRQPELFDVYRLNLITGEQQLIAENPGGIVGWLTDHEGKLRLGVKSDGVNSTILYRDSEQEPFRAILSTNFKNTFTPQCFSFTGKGFYAISNIGRDKATLVFFDPSSQTETDELFAHPEVDISGVSFSKKRRIITAVSYTTWKTERHFFDDVTKSIFDSIATFLPGRTISIPSATDDEQLLIIRSSSDREFGSSYLYDSASNTLEKLADHCDWLNPEDLCEMKPIQYTSRDGLKIHGYLTLPKNIEPANLPIVVNPHGGPWWRDSWGFQPHVQFLANRGYAVFQMNFRGSTGYGKAFWESSFKAWGGSMQNDITDGVHWLINEGIADKSRVAIFGGSYGGYAVLAGLAFTPELYACGIDFVGVSNLFTFLKSIPPYWKPMLDMLYEMVGHPEYDKLLLQEKSPVFYAEKIKAPLLVAQGAKDPRVNIEESNQIVDALRKHNIDVVYLVKENEGHGFENEENKIEFFEMMESFLAKHLSQKSSP